MIKVNVTLKDLKKLEKEIDLKLKGRDPASDKLDPILKIQLKRYSSKLYYYNATHRILHPNKYDPGHLQWCKEIHNVVKHIFVHQPSTFFSTTNSQDIKLLSAKIESLSVKIEEACDSPEYVI